MRRKLSAFQMVLVVQALRPDRQQSGKQGFWCGVEGVRRGDVEGVRLSGLYHRESSAAQPILILVA